MAVFKEYSEYYDLINRNKDYLAESDFISELIKKHDPAAKTILNLGCGTGKHDFLLSEKGYSVTGVDLSPQMISIANAQLRSSSSLKNLSFMEGDIRNIKLDTTFDVVASFFHVISYQTTNKDIQESFQTAFNHLQEDGLFIFDCWYGPGVLTDRPHFRKKTIEDDSYRLDRISEPVMFPNENCVDVHFDISYLKKQTNEVLNFKEVHKMRYLFYPELQYFLDLAGFKIIEAKTWMSDEPLTFSSWNAVFICKKTKRRL